MTVKLSQHLIEVRGLQPKHEVYMSHVYRRDSGRPIRNRMDVLGLSCPLLAEATRRVDPDKKGVSVATIGNLVGLGSSARDRYRLRTAWLVAEVLHEPLQDLFSMTAPLTVTDERAMDRADEMPGAANAAA